MKKIVRLPYTPDDKDRVAVYLNSSLEERPEGFYIYISAAYSFFHRKGTGGQGTPTSYEMQPTAKTFRYGPVGGEAWLATHRSGIELDAEMEFSQIFKAYTGRLPVIHTRRVERL